MAEQAAMVRGGCCCGSIRYELDPTEGLVVNCHCTICRKTSGAPYVTWIVVAASQFKWIEAEPATLHASSHGTRGFCSRCGTPVSFVTTKRPGQIDVTVGSLDDPNPYTPSEDVYIEDKLDWIHELK